MKIDQHKLKRQKAGFRRWKNNGCRGTFQWVTGVGKTFAAILSAKHFIKENPAFKVVVVVPTDPLRNSWRETVQEHGIADHFIIDTVHSLVKQDLSCDMLILDEIHMYVGEEAEVFPLVFTQVTTQRVLGLTATLGHKNIRRELVDANCPVVDTIDLQEAVQNNYVSDYIQYNLAVPLSDKDKIAYNKVNSDFYGAFNHFDYDFDLVKRCLSPDVARVRASRLGWSEGAVIGMARKCMKKMRERKSFLYSASCKIDAAEEIINMFPDKKYITFGQTTESADLLAERLPDAMSFHSNIQTQLLDPDDNNIGEKCGKGQYRLHKTGQVYDWKGIKEAVDFKITRLGKKKVKKYILDLFKSNELRGLCTAKALDVGFDDSSIELSVLLSGSSSQRQLIQRIGRSIRKKEGKRALIVQLYIPDTQDEQWLNNRQTNNSNVKNIVSTSQIAA